MSAIVMRAPCVTCDSTDGRLEERNGQDCVFCTGCGRFAYNAPKTETGRAVRSVSTVHEALRPRQRARVLLRATGRCELCGASGPLHVGHLLSVAAALEAGLTEPDIHSDENLAAMCAECNLGVGAEPVPLRVAIAIVMRRLRVQRASA